MASYGTFGACLGYQHSFYYWAACEQALVIASVLGDITVLLAENMEVKPYKLKALKNCIINIR